MLTDLSRQLSLLAVLCLTVLSGCREAPVDTPPTAGGATSGDTGATTMAVPTLPESPAFDTDFGPVANHLNAGGSFYMFLSTRALIERLEAMAQLATDVAREQLAATPDSPPNPDAQNVVGSMQLFNNFLDTSGLKEVRAVGISAYPLNERTTHTRAILYRQPGDTDGKLWSILGGESKPLATLDFMPADTVLAGYTNLDVDLAYSWIRETLANSDVPLATQRLSQFETELQKMGVDLQQLLASTDGGFGFALTLNPKRTISYMGFQVPEPAFFFFSEVKDDTLYQRVEGMASQQQQFPIAQEQGTGYRLVSSGISLAGNLQPAIMQTKTHLMLGSSSQILKQINDLQSDADAAGPSLTSSDEYQQLARYMPATGNHWYYVSSRFSTLINNLQESILSRRANNVGNAEAETLQRVQELMRKLNPQLAMLTIATLHDDGLIIYANSQINPIE